MASIIKNKTRNKTIGKDPRWLTTSLQQQLGFMFTTPQPHQSMIFVFEPQQPVHFHMFFVFGPIDIIALDNNNTIIALREHFKPWTTWNPHLHASIVLELPAGTIKKTKTSIGDKIQLPKPTNT